MARTSLTHEDLLANVYRQLEDLGLRKYTVNKPKRQSQFPKLSPDEEHDVLEKIGHGSMGLASALGAALDTPGGAVRDLAVGKNPLPQIFDPEKRTSGRQLLEHYKLAPRSTGGFDRHDLGALAAEIALDPTTYMSFGASAVGKAGKIAKAVGMLPKTRIGRLTDTLADVARRATPEQLAALESAAGGAANLAKHVAAAKPLGGLLRLHVPDAVPFIGGAEKVLATGAQAQKLARRLDNAQETLRYTAPARHLAALFNYDSRDVISKEAQLARQAMTAAETKARADAQGHVVSALRMLKESGVPAERMNALLDPLVEGLSLPANHGLTPDQATKLTDAANFMRQQKDAVHQAIQHHGYDIADMAPDLHVEHFPRYLSPYVKKKGVLGFNKLFDTSMDSTLARQDFLRNVPRGREALNRMASDPFLVGAKRRAPSDAMAASYIHARHGVADPDQLKQLVHFFHDKEELGPLFDDPLRDFAHYLGQGHRTLAAVQHAKDFVLSHQAPMAKGMVPVAQVMRKLGFHTAGIPAGMGLRADLANDATKMIKGVQAGDALHPLIDAWDKLRQLWKTGHTTPFPGFHVRNFLQTGLWMQYANKATDPTKKGPLALVQPWLDAADLLKGKAVRGAARIPGIGAATDAEGTERLADELFQHDVLAHTLSHDVAGQITPKPTGNLFSRIQPQVAGNSPTPPLRSILTAGAKAAANVQGTGKLSRAASVLNAPVRGALGAGAQAANNVEAMNRASMYIAFRRQGMSAAAAARRVKDINVDYGRVTDFERKVMSRAMPFYKFTAGMLPEVTRDVAEHPGGAPAQMMKAVYRNRQKTGFLPPYLGGGLAIPIGAESPEGQQRYLTQMDLPHEQLNLAEVGPGGVQKTLLNLAGMLDPIPKTIAEVATNRSFYQDRDLRDLDPRVGRILTQMGLLKHPKQVPTIPEHIAMSLLPTGRAVSTLGQLMDNRKQPWVKAINVLSGVKLSDVDMAHQQEIGARNLVRDLLRGEPGVGSREDIYAARPEEMTPEGRQLMRFIRTLQARATKIQKERERQAMGRVSPSPPS